MLARILISLGVCIFAVIVPVLEINVSHVFNPDWPAHARFHEVWQLFTNCGIGLLCLWLTWLKNNVRLASVLIVLVMGGVLFAHATETFYGGSVLSGNLSKTLLGLELAAFAACLAIVFAMVAAVLDMRSKVQ
ncbi:hypothetical protein ACFOEK_09975 [Litoribrevibacter euphylliae]|uniref:Uncharacterized protein n=1 Tax=Litoribrevibacter euphylliae TaxID=1834034 RepID=A0ABV7HF66_9GAMM